MYNYIAYITSLFFSIIGGIIAWKTSNLFISKRDFYRKSTYDILYMKAFKVLSFMIFIFIITIAIFGFLKDKI